MPNTPHHTAKMKSCVDDLMKKGHDESSAYAICTATLQDAGDSVFEKRDARPSRLTEILFDRIDLVDRGANPAAHVVLFKRDQEPKIMAEDTTMVDLEKRLSDQAAAFQKQLDENNAAAKTEKEALAKRLDDAEALAKSERDKRVTREYVEKCQGFVALPVDPQKDALILKAIDEKLTPEEAGRVTELLRSADNLIAQSQMFTEIGARGAGAEGTAFAKIQALAKDKIAKGLAKSEPEAVTQVASENAALYAQYEQEKLAAAKR